MKSASRRLSWCQSVGVRGNGGLERRKGRAVGLGLERQVDWKVEGREAGSGVSGGVGSGISAGR